MKTEFKEVVLILMRDERKEAKEKEGKNREREEKLGT